MKHHSQRLVNSVALVVLLLGCVRLARAQEAAPVPQLSDVELLMSAEADVAELRWNWLNETNVAHRALRKFKTILQSQPDTPYRLQIQEDLKPVYEVLGKQNLAIADFYMKRYERDGKGLNLKGAESRLLLIAREYSTFSKMDQVLFRLGAIAANDKRDDDVSRYLGQLVCDYPNSRYVARAFQRLNESTPVAWEGCGKFKP